jgi:16S rRNA (guanine527-N7)-methyltransferase
MMDDPISAGSRLNQLLADAGLDPLSSELTGKFAEYCSLILRWNARVNLTAIRDEDGILARHFVESIACARALPAGIETLLDFGSGAGFPGIPIALCRPEIMVTLAESQGKKAAFLQEAIRVLEISAKVHPHRAELLAGRFDCVTLRAVDRMGEAVGAAGGLVAPGGWLVLMSTWDELSGLQRAAGAGFSWSRVVQLPGGDARLVALGERSVSSPV